MAVYSKHADVTTQESDVEIENLMPEVYPLAKQMRMANGRYVHLLRSIDKRVDKIKQSSTSVTIHLEAMGFDRRFLAQLIPRLFNQVSLVGINKTKLYIHLTPFVIISTDTDDSLSESTSTSNNDFVSRLLHFIRQCVFKIHPTDPYDLSEIPPEEDQRIQGTHLRQYQHLCQRVKQAYQVSKVKNSFLMMSFQADLLLAKGMIRAMDPTLLPFVIFNIGDGYLRFKRQKVSEESKTSMELFDPPSLENDGARKLYINLAHSKITEIAKLPEAITFIASQLYHQLPTVKQLQTICLEFFISRCFESTLKTAQNELSSSSLLLFFFKLRLHELYHEMLYLHHGMSKKQEDFNHFILILKKIKSQLTLPQFFDAIKTIEDKQLRKVIFGDKELLTFLQKPKQCNLLWSEAYQIRSIQNQTLTYSEEGRNPQDSITAEITPEKIIRSIYPFDGHPLWLITINELPFHSEATNQLDYLSELLQAIYPHFKDDVQRNIQQEARNIVEGVNYTMTEANPFRNGYIIQKMQSDAFPILQRMTMEMWKPADDGIRKKWPQVFENFHLRRLNPQQQLCLIQINSPNDYQVTHKYAYVLSERLSPFAVGQSFATMSFEWMLSQKEYLKAELKIRDFKYTPSLEGRSDAQKLKSSISKAFSDLI